MKTVKLIAEQVRIHHWVKNLLVFVPFIAAHKWNEPSLWFKTMVAFVCMSLVASVVYVINDLIDLKSDRAHATKRKRPLASGALTPPVAASILAVAMGGAFFLSISFLNEKVLALFLLYVLLNLFYSFTLKKKVMVDVVILALLFAGRVYAGGIATDTPVSHWLLGFSIFIFFGLACAKRVIEIQRYEDARHYGRAYTKNDLVPLTALGIGSSLLSILVAMLYFHSESSLILYAQPQLLWLMIPVLLFWVARVWILVYRGEVHDDPIVFAIKDRVSWACLGVLSVVLMASKG